MKPPSPDTLQLWPPAGEDEDLQVTDGGAFPNEKCPLTAKSVSPLPWKSERWSTHGRHGQHRVSHTRHRPGAVTSSRSAVRHRLGERQLGAKTGIPTTGLFGSHCVSTLDSVVIEQALDAAHSSLSTPTTKPNTAAVQHVSDA